ncbi:MAG: hypothetical protein KJN81_01085 [Acidimicrobiia bacterium]|nr:hypothetical protein [Acidimicrobiia bacterium]NNL27001.1 hypothetical protein [Acidimicrobiia bacterium]
MRWFRNALVLAGALWIASAGMAFAAEGDAVGMFDPNTGIWTLTLPNGDSSAFYYGNPGDMPMMGDWDCEGGATVGMYRPSNGFVYVRNTNDFGVADYDFFYGNPGDVPVAGDWNGDGCTTLAIHRGGSLYVSNRLATGFADFVFAFGQPGHTPFSADFNGDGKDSIGFFDPSTARVYWRDTLTAGQPTVSTFLGIPGDQLVAGDWGQGFDTNAVVRGNILYFETPNGIQEFAVGGRGTAVNGKLSYTSSNSTIAIMPVGDSITEGNPGEYTYRYFLYRELVGAGYPIDMIGSRTGVCCDGAPADPNFDQDHQAWSGATSDEIAGRVRESEARYRPGIAILHVGTNDIWGPPPPGVPGDDPNSPNTSYDIDASRANMLDLIASLRRSNPDVDIVLSTLIPCDLGLVCSERIPELNNMIRSLVKPLSTDRSRIVLVDLDGVVGIDDLVDGVHPGRNGQAAMARAYDEAVRSLVTVRSLPLPDPIPLPDPLPPRPLLGGPALLSDLLDELESVDVGGRAQRHLAEAKAAVTDALNDGGWDHNRAIQPSILRNMSGAIAQLEQALKRHSSQPLKSVEGRLLGEMQAQAEDQIILATGAIERCTSACAVAVDALKVAQDAYSAGVDAVAESSSVVAAEQFDRAWGLANRAEQAASS